MNSLINKGGLGQPILIHGSVLREDKDSIPNDIDVVTLQQLTDEDIERIKEWLRGRGLSDDLPIDHAISIDDSTGVLTVPSPQGLVVPFEVLGDENTPVRIVALNGLSSAIRANLISRKTAEGWINCASHSLSLTEDTYDEVGGEMGWDKYAIGLTGFRHAVHKNRERAEELLTQHPFGSVLIRLIDENPTNKFAYRFFGSWRHGAEIHFSRAEDGKSIALLESKKFKSPEELEGYLFIPEGTVHPLDETIFAAEELAIYAESRASFREKLMRFLGFKTVS